MALHPVDIKAELKKRFGSVLAFERARGLPFESVRDVLRGRRSWRVAETIADELGLDMQEQFPEQLQSRKRDDSAESGHVHPRIGPE
ncbi:MAG: helix-turn-helix domain-containing protein [Parasphingopyxis sp.]|nr:helix-turn-helix domain-containing protein [Sphingomonadales bacterium]